MDNAIIVEGLEKRFGSVVALDGVDFSVPTGTRARAARPERRGQDHCGAHAHHDPAARRGPRRGARHRRRAANPQAVRERIGLAGQYAAVDENLTGHENLRMVGRLSHLSEDGRPRAGRRAARAVRPRRRRRPSGAHLLRRHAPPARPRRRARAPPAGAVPRRADHRARPAAAARISGASSKDSCATARRCCSPRSTSKRPTASPTTSS